MLEIKFLQQDDLSEITDNLFVRLGHTSLYRGFIVFGDKDSEPYCEFVVYTPNSFSGYRGYKVRAATKVTETITGKKLVPSRIIDDVVRYKNLAFGNKREAELFRKLEDLYKAGLINAYEYFDHAKIIGMSKKELRAMVSKDVKRRWGFLGCYMGLASGIVIYNILEMLDKLWSIRVVSPTDYSKIVGITTFIGGVCDSSIIPEFKVWRKMLNLTHEAYGVIMSQSGSLEERVS